MKFNKLVTALFLSVTSQTLFAGENINAIEPIMATIPAGSFEMGSSVSENAQPIHIADIPQHF